MQNLQPGIVLAVSGRRAEVKASRHNDCSSCGACPGNSAMVLDAYNPVGAKVGQQVMVEIQEVNMLYAAFLVYIMPLIAIFAGVWAGDYAAGLWSMSEVLARIAGGFVFFGLAVAYVKRFDYLARTDAKYQPVIVAIKGRQ